MQIQSEVTDTTLVLSLVQSRILAVDLINRLGEELRSAVESSQKRHVLLDLASVKYMSSHMIAQVVRLNLCCAERKARLHICSASNAIRESFRVLLLDKSIDFHETSDDAFAAMALSANSRFSTSR